MTNARTEEVEVSAVSTHRHAASGEQVTVKVDYGVVRRETQSERDERRKGELPVMKAAAK